MIIIKLWGGLGNQLFQYAFGYSLATKNNQKLCFDVDFYDNQVGNMDLRKVRLKNLNIGKLDIVKRPKGVRFLENRYINHLIRYFPKFRIKVKGNIVFEKEIKRDGTEILIESLSDYYLDGYWQTEAYFAEYRDSLIEQFKYNGNFDDDRISLNEEILNCNSVAIHIRRGDVLKRNGVKNVRHDLPLEYYYDAIRYIKERVENPVFYVFSDDPNWVKENLKIDSDVFFPSLKDKDGDIADLWSIAYCKHGIMSASTFSWWGNWLRETNGIVIAPTGNHFNERFFVDDWVRL